VGEGVAVTVRSRHGSAVTQACPACTRARAIQVHLDPVLHLRTFWHTSTLYWIQTTASATATPSITLPMSHMSRAYYMPSLVCLPNPRYLTKQNAVWAALGLNLGIGGQKFTPVQVCRRRTCLFVFTVLPNQPLCVSQDLLPEPL
jgi:hypothetical protein